MGEIDIKERMGIKFLAKYEKKIDISQDKLNVLIVAFFAPMRETFIKCLAKHL